MFAIDFETDRYTREDAVKSAFVYYRARPLNPYTLPKAVTALFLKIDVIAFFPLKA